MKSGPRLQRQAAHLSEEDFKKIFPQQYYQKYAPQQKIRQFQQQLLRENKTPPPTLTKRQSTPDIIKLVPPTKLTMFDTASDVIIKNKEEAKRMEAFVKDVNHKLKNGPVGNTPKIRTPLTGFAALPEGVFDRLKLLQDAQYQAQMQYIREKKSKAKQYVSFVRRGNNSLSVSKLDVKIEGSIAGNSAESKSIKDFNISNSMLLHSIQPTSNNNLLGSNTKNQPVSYEQKVRQIVDKARSQINLLNPQHKHSQVQCIMTINRSIKKLNGLSNQRAIQRRITSLAKTGDRIKSSHSEGNTQKKKDLVAMTQNIRQEVNNLELLSHFDTIMAQRSLRLRLEQIK